MDALRKGGKEPPKSDKKKTSSPSTSQPLGRQTPDQPSTLNPASQKAAKQPQNPSTNLSKAQPSADSAVDKTIGQSGKQPSASNREVLSTLSSTNTAPAPDSQGPVSKNKSKSAAKLEKLRPRRTDTPRGKLIWPDGQTSSIPSPINGRFPGQTYSHVPLPGKGKCPIPPQVKPPPGFAAIPEWQKLVGYKTETHWRSHRGQGVLALFYRGLVGVPPLELSPDGESSLPVEFLRSESYKTPLEYLQNFFGQNMNKAENNKTPPEEAEQIKNFLGDLPGLVALMRVFNGTKPDWHTPWFFKVPSWVGKEIHNARQKFDEKTWSPEAMVMLLILEMPKGNPGGLGVSYHRRDRNQPYTSAERIKMCRSLQKKLAADAPKMAPLTQGSVTFQTP